MQRATMVKSSTGARGDGCGFLHWNADKIIVIEAKPKICTKRPQSIMRAPRHENMGGIRRIEIKFLDALIM